MEISFQDVGASDAKLTASILVGDEFCCHVRQRHTDIAGAFHRLMRLKSRRCGFRHTPAGKHQRDLASNVLGEARKCLPNVLWNRCCGVKNQVAITQIRTLESLILSHSGDKLRETDRHVEGKCSALIADVPYRSRKPCLGRLAIVNVEAAAIRKHHIEIVAAAEHMVPREPVQDLRRTRCHDRHHSCHLSLVDAEHAVRRQHAFRVCG